MEPDYADIIGHWKTGVVSINGKCITLDGFVRDLKAAEDGPGDNNDIISECKRVRRFRWGNTTQATYCLALACCFYLRLKWVMDRFFKKELEGVRQADFRLKYDNDQLDAAYQHCEDLFAQEFKENMGKLGAVEIEK